MSKGRIRAEAILRTAWDKLNREEVEKVVPKAVEYGSGDLRLMGFALKMLLNSPRARERDWTEAESEEIACSFYILGKVARMFSAYERGAMPTDDQPHDIGVYTRMIQILRSEGAWPPGFEEYLKGEENNEEHHVTITEDERGRLEARCETCGWRVEGPDREIITKLARNHAEVRRVS